MHERIKQIRKSAGLNQSDFAASLGLSRNMIAQVETQKERFSDRSIRDLCRIYNVNEEWLRSGEGEPYMARPINQQIAEFVNSTMEEVNDSVRKRLILALSKLDVDEWAVLDKIAREMVKAED